MSNCSNEMLLEKEFEVQYNKAIAQGWPEDLAEDYARELAYMALEEAAW
jgi:hypothetical protein